MRAPSFSSRYPAGVPGYRSSHYRGSIGATIPRSIYRYPNIDLYIGSYPSYVNRYPYSSGLYPSYAYPYGSSLRYTLPYGYGTSAIVAVPPVAAVPQADLYPYQAYQASPTISPSAIEPYAKPIPDDPSVPARLLRSLSTRQGEPWLEYLMPERVIEAIETNDLATLRELAKRYDGVVNNPQLRWLANLSGFAATRSLIHQYVDASAVEKPQMNQPEALPTPAVDAGDEV